MNDLDHISEILETIFRVKILNFLDADPEWQKFRSGIRYEKNSDPGRQIRIRDKRPRIGNTD